MFCVGLYLTRPQDETCFATNLVTYVSTSYCLSVRCALFLMCGRFVLVLLLLSVCISRFAVPLRGTCIMPKRGHVGHIHIRRAVCTRYHTPHINRQTLHTGLKYTRVKILPCPPTHLQSIALNIHEVTRTSELRCFQDTTCYLKLIGTE